MKKLILILALVLMASNVFALDVYKLTFKTGEIMTLSFEDKGVNFTDGYLAYPDSGGFDLTGIKNEESIRFFNISEKEEINLYINRFTGIGVIHWKTIKDKSKDIKLYFSCDKIDRKF